MPFYKKNSKHLSFIFLPNPVSHSLALAVHLTRIFLQQLIYWISHSSGVNLCVLLLEIPDRLPRLGQIPLI